MKKAKRSLKPIATMIIQQLTMRLIPTFISRQLLDYTASKCTLVFSNVPGFKIDLSINGSKATNMLFFCPQMSKVGLGISMLSHVDHLKMGVASDMN